MSNADELMVSEKTAYNYLNAGLFDADKMDCPRIIRMRPRRSTPKLKIDRHCYEAALTKILCASLRITRMFLSFRWTLSLETRVGKSF